MINIEDTANDNVKKFISDDALLENQDIVFFGSIEEAEGKSKMCVDIMNIGNINRIILGQKYIAVFKNDEIEWNKISPKIISIMEKYLKLPKEEILLEEETNIDNSIDDIKQFIETLDKDESDPIIQQISEIIEERIKPGVHMDGGDIAFHGIDKEKGIVYVELMGACTSCSMSDVTLKEGILKMLQHYIPEIKDVQNIVLN